MSRIELPASIDHLKTMQPSGSQQQPESSFWDGLRAHWPGRGFEVNRCATRYTLGEGSIWPFIGMDSSTHVDGWAELAAGEPVVDPLMGPFLKTAAELRAGATLQGWGRNS